MLTALTASLVLAAVATPVTPTSDNTRYVAADVLLLRSSPEPTGDVIGRVLINTALTVVGERNGYAQVQAAGIDPTIGHQNPPAAPHVWVSGVHLAEAPITAQAARLAFQQAVDAGDGELVGTWAERVIAIEGRRPRSLTLLAQAAALQGDEVRRARVHQEMEHGRTLIGACGMTGAYLLGELFDDGRFVSAVYQYPERWQLDGMVPTDVRTRRARARLERLAREVASMRFVDAANDRLLPGSPFASARLLGLESSVVADEIELTHGLKVGMGTCPTELQGRLFASRPLKRVDPYDPWPRQLTPARSARLIKSAADKVNAPEHKELGDVLDGAQLRRVPGEPTDAPPRVIRRATFTRGGHYEPYILTRWALLDGDDRVLVELDVPGTSYGRRTSTTWFRSGERRFVFLNWGGEMQSGVQVVFLDASGKVAHEVMPTIVASGC